MSFKDTFTAKPPYNISFPKREEAVNIDIYHPCSLLILCSCTTPASPSIFHSSAILLADTTDKYLGMSASDRSLSNPFYPIRISPFACSSSMIISPTDGTAMVPDSGFLMLMTGVVITASTSDFSKQRSVSVISQSISFRFLQ